MAQFKPSLPFATAMIVLTPSYVKAGGVRSKVLPSLDKGFQIFGTFKTYGGTETTIDGVYSIINTAFIETWYRPDIKSDCIIVMADTGQQFEIIGEPENINRRNQFLKLRVQSVKGGA